MKETLSLVLIAAFAVHLCHKYEASCLQNFLFNGAWSEQKVKYKVKESDRETF